MSEVEASARDLFRDDPRRGFIAVTRTLADAAGPDGLSIRDIVDRLDERAIGLAILVMAIPCLVPGLYGPPQILGIPIILLAGQLLFGRRELWLPDRIMTRRVAGSWLKGMADFAERRLSWLERLAGPRLTPLTTGMGERFAGAMMIVATLCILPPITNTVPSIALALLAVGILERDGLFVAIGAAIAAAWATLLATVIVGVVFGAGFLAGWAQDNLPWLVEHLGR